MIRLGLLGATTIAERAVIGPAALRGDVEVSAVAASDHARAEAFGARHGIERVHKGYDALLADERIDAVYVSTHPAAHFGLALAAMRAGKHVLVEKPLCLTAREAHTLRLAMRRAGVCLVEAVMTAHHPWPGEVMHLAGAHGLGEFREIRSTIVFDRRAGLGYRAFPELGGGAFWDAAPYWLRMLQAVTGLDAAGASADSNPAPDGGATSDGGVVSGGAMSGGVASDGGVAFGGGMALDGRSAFDGPNGIDVRFEGEVQYGTGVTATLTCALDAPFTADHDFTFAGGTMRVRNFLRPAWGTFQLNLFVRPAHGPPITVGFPPVSYHERQLAAFAELLTAADGRGAAALDGAVERVEIAERIHLSALRKHASPRPFTSEDD
jgi:predicted dehydrogenase